MNQQMTAPQEPSKDNAPHVQRWISVKDRLPEKYIQVLCYGFEPSNIHDDGLPFKTGIFNGKEWISDHFCESSYIQVTHWMPLPIAPEVKNEK